MYESTISPSHRVCPRALREQMHTFRHILFLFCLLVFFCRIELRRIRALRTNVNTHMGMYIYVYTHLTIFVLMIFFLSHSVTKVVVPFEQKFVWFFSSYVHRCWQGCMCFCVNGHDYVRLDEMSIYL